MLKKEEEEAANAQERLVNPSDNKAEQKDEEKSVEKMADEAVKEKDFFDDENSDSSEKIDEELQKEQVENHNGTNAPNDDLNGSTVEIIQPADLKPKHLGFTRNLLLAMFAAMIGTGAQFGYALGVMNAPSDVMN